MREVDEKEDGTAEDGLPIPHEQGGAKSQRAQGDVGDDDDEPGGGKTMRMSLGYAPLSSPEYICSQACWLVVLVVLAYTQTFRLEMKTGQLATYLVLN